MARKRVNKETDAEEGGLVPAGPACLPRLVFLGLLLLLAAMGTVEVRQGFRHASVLRVPGTSPAPGLVFYQKGRASAREAWLFDEPQGTAGPPRLIQRIECSAVPQAVGEIAWTSDGKAVFAAGRRLEKRGEPLVRWLFEFETARLYLSDPEFSLPGRTAFVEDPAALTDRWRRHGGTGATAANWYDLGAIGPRLFSWQATRWEQALPE